MKVEAVIAALDLPNSAMVNQRVPKKLLAENGAPTSADKKSILDDIEEVLWIAALKPSNVAVPAYQDNTRTYAEIAVICLELRESAKVSRIAELVHRAVPYPVVLLVRKEADLFVSVVNIRKAQNEAEKTVLDGKCVLAAIKNDVSGDRFLRAVSMLNQPRTDLFALYQGWIDTAMALEAAEITGNFNPSNSREQAQNRHDALQQCREVKAKLDTLRLAAKKERQLARQVALNNEIRSISAELAAAITVLNQGTL